MTLSPEETQLHRDLEKWSEHVDQLVASLEDEPPEDGGSGFSWLELARAVLDERHAIESRLREAARSRPEHAVLDAELLALLMDADEELSKHLWRLTVLNDYRREKLEEVAQELRAPLWWYARGVHVPASAVPRVGEIASLVASFPEAGAELAALSAAEQQLLGPVDAGKRELVGAGEGASEESVGAQSLEATQTSAPVSAVEGYASGERADCLRLRRSWVVGGAALAAGALFALGGTVYMKAAEQAEQDRAALLREVTTLRDEAEERLTRLEEALKAKEEVHRAQRMALEKALSRAEAADQKRDIPAAAAASGVTSRRPATTASGAKAGCSPGDPMCSGL